MPEARSRAFWHEQWVAGWIYGGGPALVFACLKTTDGSEYPATLAMQVIYIILGGVLLLPSAGAMWGGGGADMSKGVCEVWRLLLMLTAAIAVLTRVNDGPDDPTDSIWEAVSLAACVGGVACSALSEPPRENILWPVADVLRRHTQLHGVMATLSSFALLAINFDDCEADHRLLFEWGVGLWVAFELLYAVSVQFEEPGVVLKRCFGVGLLSLVACDVTVAFWSVSASLSSECDSAVGPGFLFIQGLIWCLVALAKLTSATLTAGDADIDFVGDLWVAMGFSRGLADARGRDGQLGPAALALFPWAAQFALLLLPTLVLVVVTLGDGLSQTSSCDDDNSAFWAIMVDLGAGLGSLVLLFITSVAEANGWRHYPKLCVLDGVYVVAQLVMRLIYGMGLLDPNDCDDSEPLRLLSWLSTNLLLLVCARGVFRLLQWVRVGELRGQMWKVLGSNEFYAHYGSRSLVTQLASDGKFYITACLARLLVEGNLYVYLRRQDLLEDASALGAWLEVSVFFSLSAVCAMALLLPATRMLAPLPKPAMLALTGLLPVLHVAVGVAGLIVGLATSDADDLARGVAVCDLPVCLLGGLISHWLLGGGAVKWPYAQALDEATRVARFVRGRPIDVAPRGPASSASMVVPLDDFEDEMAVVRPQAVALELLQATAVCSVCTFENEPRAVACAMCATALPGVSQLLGGEGEGGEGRPAPLALSRQASHEHRVLRGEVREAMVARALNRQHSSGGGGGGGEQQQQQQQQQLVKQESVAGAGKWRRVRQADGTLVWERPGADANSAPAAAALPFAAKVSWIRREMGRLRVPWESGHLELDVRRSHLFEDSVAQLNAAPKEALRQELRIKFRDEPALDAGGVSREWYQLIGEAAFARDSPVFQFSEVDNLCYNLRPCVPGREVPEADRQLLRFAGRFLGKALFDGQAVGVHLARPLYKHILGAAVSFGDLEFVDRQLYCQLTQMLGNAGVETLYVFFSTVMDGEELPLSEGGLDRQVTDENKAQFARELFRFKLLDTIAAPLSEFLEGLFEAVPEELLAAFDSQELELLMAGVDEIDLEDWRRNTVYQNEFRRRGAAHPVVRWFWQVVAEEMSQDERARLLQFTTGTSRVPVGGFSQLQRNGGVTCRFTLTSTDQRLPHASTCFNRLQLPAGVASRQEMRELLHLITEMDVTGFSEQ